VKYNDFHVLGVVVEKCVEEVKLVTEGKKSATDLLHQLKSIVNQGGPLLRQTDKILKKMRTPAKNWARPPFAVGDDQSDSSSVTSETSSKASEASVSGSELNIYLEALPPVPFGVKLNFSEVKTKDCGQGLQVLPWPTGSDARLPTPKSVSALFECVELLTALRTLVLQQAQNSKKKAKEDRFQALLHLAVSFAVQQLELEDIEILDGSKPHTAFLYCSARWAPDCKGKTDLLVAIGGVLVALLELKLNFGATQYLWQTLCSTWALTMTAQGRPILGAVLCPSIGTRCHFSEVDHVHLDQAPIPLADAVWCVSFTQPNYIHIPRTNRHAHSHLSDLLRKAKNQWRVQIEKGEDAEGDSADEKQEGGEGDKGGGDGDKEHRSGEGDETEDGEDNDSKSGAAEGAQRGEVARTFGAVLDENTLRGLDDASDWQRKTSYLHKSLHGGYDDRIEV
jgi:hypothetical protein